MSAAEYEQRRGVIPWRDLAVRLIWRPEHSEQIVVCAEHGDLRPLALFLDALRTDDTVTAVKGHLLSMLRLPIQWSGDPMTVRALRGVPERRENGRRIPSIPGDFWKMCPMAELREVIWDGYSGGLGLGELVPVPGTDLPRLRNIPLAGVRVDFSGGVQRLYYQSQGNSYDIEPGSGRWVVFQPYGAVDWYRKSPYRGAFLPYVKKMESTRHQLRKMGDIANTLHVIIANPNRTGTERDDLETFGRDYWQSDGFLVLEKDESVSTMEASGEGWQFFDGAYDRADKALAKVFAGQSVTTDGVAGGLNNSGGLWANIANGIIEELGDRVGECLERDIFQPYARRRRLSTDVSGRWDVRSPATKVAEAKAASEAAKAMGDVNKTLEEGGYKQRVRVDAYLEDLGFGSLPLESTEPAEEVEAEIVLDDVADVPAMAAGAQPLLLQAPDEELADEEAIRVYAAVLESMAKADVVAIDEEAEG